MSPTDLRFEGITLRLGQTQLNFPGGLVVLNAQRSTFVLWPMG